MDKCSCYCVEKNHRFLSQFEQGVIFAQTGEYKESLDVIEGRCLGTKEMERRKCGGDRSKCDFYPTTGECG